MERSKCIHARFTLEEFVPDTFGNRHGRKPLPDEIELVDQREIEKG
ncbi:MAG: hypothetical protein ACOCSN_05680 [Halanaeroarchaeum sp.]